MFDLKLLESQFFIKKEDNTIEETNGHTLGLYYEDYNHTLVNHYGRYTFNTYKGESGSKITFQIKTGSASSLGCVNPGIKGWTHETFATALNKGSIKLYCAITPANGNNIHPSVSESVELPLRYLYSIQTQDGTSYLYETGTVEIPYEIYSNQEYYLWIYIHTEPNNYVLFYVPSLSNNYLEYVCQLSGEISTIEESIQPYECYKPKIFYQGKYVPCKAYIYDNNEFINYRQEIAIASFDTKLYSSTTGASKPILYNDEVFDLKLWIKKNFGSNQKMRINITLKNHGNNTSAHKYGDIVIPANNYTSINLIEQFSEYQQILQKYGFFTISVNIQDLNTKEVVYSINYPFCRIRQSPALMPLFGMNTTIPPNREVATNFINRIVDTGASLYRVTLPWESVESNQGILQVPPLAIEAIDYAKSKGIKVLIILAYGNKLYGNPNPTDSAWLTAYMNYCKAVTQQLKGKVNYYEIWNEWNHPTMSKIPLEYQDGKNYAKVLDAAYDAIQNEDPEAEIIGGAVAGIPESWIEEVKQNSKVFDNLHNFSFHQYPLINNEFVKPLNYDFDKCFNSIHKLVGNKSIWLTEFGWPTHEGTSSKYKGVSEQEAAAYMVQFYMWALANQNNYNIKNVCLYTLMNTGNTITYPQHNFGLVYHYNASIPYAPKAGFSASNAMSYFVSQMQTMPTKSANSTENITIYQCNSNNNKIMQVIWANSEQEQTYTITNAQVMDIYGTVTNYPNQTVLTITETPIYILYN